MNYKYIEEFGVTVDLDTIGNNKGVTNGNIFAWLSFCPKVVHYPIFTQILDGKSDAGICLSQLYYWCHPSMQGKSKMSIIFDGKYWIAKTHEEWAKEVGSTTRIAQNTFKVLENKGLIKKMTRKFYGINTLHVHLNWSKLLKLLNDHIDKNPDAKLPANIPDFSETQGYISCLTYQGNNSMPIAKIKSQSDYCKSVGDFAYKKSPNKCKNSEVKSSQDDPKNVPQTLEPEVEPQNGFSMPTDQDSLKHENAISTITKITTDPTRTNHSIVHTDDEGRTYAPNPNSQALKEVSQELTTPSVEATPIETPYYKFGTSSNDFSTPRIVPMDREPLKEVVTNFTIEKLSAEEKEHMIAFYEGYYENMKNEATSNILIPRSARLDDNGNILEAPKFESMGNIDFHIDPKQRARDRVELGDKLYEKLDMDRLDEASFGIVYNSFMSMRNDPFMAIKLKLSKPLHELKNCFSMLKKEHVLNAWRNFMKYAPKKKVSLYMTKCLLSSLENLREERYITEMEELELNMGYLS